MKLRNKLFRRKSFALSRQPIFIHIPKTGGTALEHCFKQAGLRINNLLHTPARFIKERFPDNYKDQFTFTIVRNPYARFLSACRYNGVDDENIEELSSQIKGGNVDWCSNFSIHHYEHFFTQKHFITDFDNETIIVDYIGKFEDLQNVIDILKENDADISKYFEVKASKSSDWENILTQETKDNIQSIYSEDFTLFNNFYKKYITN
jgi:hypothetical protein